MRKNVFAAALTLTLGVGSFAACSSDDVVTPDHDSQTLGGTTFMTVKFAMPQGDAQRSTDYNSKGVWGGRDDIQGYKAYIFNADSKLEAVQILTATEITQALDGNNYVAKPKKAIRVKPGNKTVYVVVNPNAETDALLPEVLATTTLTEFKTAYEGKNLAIAGAGVATSATAATMTTSADKVSKITAANKDVIVMTGLPGTVTVADNVTETEALVDGSSNQVNVSVKRMVARVVVTSTEDKYEFKGDDPYTTGTVETDYKIGTISNLHFVTAQSERAAYFQQHENTALSSTIAKFDSPAFAQNADNTYGTKGSAVAANILAAYDYTNLWKNYTATGVSGNTVAKESQTWTAENIGQLTHNTDFILPTTHQYVTPANGADYKYRKGNTAYVLIRGLFVPEQIVVGEDYAQDTEVKAARDANKLAEYVAAVQKKTKATLNADATVKTPVAATTFDPAKAPEVLVYGLGTKKFYSSVYASQDPVFQGAVGQPIQKFVKVTEGTKVGYKMLYFAWVNPDVVGGWYNSPVYRNNIYHVEIDGIGGLGENWNPLVPATPSVPSNDKDHPNNPDPFQPNEQVKIPQPTPGGSDVPNPKPIDPPTPPTPPVKPEDPLTQPKTHMSVKVTVLPWQVHSYKFPLKN